MRDRYATARPPSPLRLLTDYSVDKMFPWHTRPYLYLRCYLQDCMLRGPYRQRVVEALEQACEEFEAE